MAESTRARIRIPEPTEVLRSLSATFARLRAPEYQALIAIVLLAAILRLGYLDLIPFGSAQARQLQHSAPLAEAFRLPLAGVESSLGIPNPPWASYLLAAPLLVNRDPRIAAAFVGLLSLAALIGCYASVRRFYGQRAAAFSALLLAANPWATASARSLSADSLLLPFGVLLLHGLSLALIARKPWGWVLACAALGLSIGVSLMALLLVPVVLLLVLIYHRRVSWIHMLFGLCLILLILFPYFYHLNATHLTDWDGLLSALRARDSASPAHVLRLASELHSGAQLAALAGVSASDYVAGPGLLRLLDPIGQALFWLALLALILLAAYAWSRWRQGEDPARYLQLIAWLWLPLALLLLLNPAWLMRQDLLVLYPAGFVAMGALLDKLLALPEGLFARRRWWAPLAQMPLWLLLVCLLGWQAYTTLYLDTFVARHDTTGGYGAPYRYLRRTATVLTRQVGEAHADQVWLLTDTTDPAQDGLAPALAYLLGPGLQTLAVGQGATQALPLPAERPGVYLLTHASPDISATLRQLGSENKGLVTFPAGSFTASVEVAPAQPAATLLERIQQRGLWAFESGPLFLGYDWPADARAGSTARLATYWTFANPSGAENVPHEVILHLASATVDSQTYTLPFGLPTAFWQSGLVLVAWYDLPLPTTAGDYTLALGLRRASDGSYSPYIDAEGNAHNTLAILGLVSTSP